MARGDVRVQLRLVDHATPALRRISRQLWWMRHGPTVMAVLIAVIVVLASVAGFLLGRLSA